ncbi:MAG: hypothetical protein QXL17_02450 [Candidatus Thermoplasmatota archaeon]
MSRWYTPLFLGKTLKSYLCNLDRLQRFSEEQLQKYQDKSLQKITRFAFTVPLYHDLYHHAGVKLQDIRGVDDLSKLPFIGKEEIRQYYPNGIIPTTKNIRDLIQISTSGTTGKSLALFVDYFDIIQGLFGYLRVLREHDIHWPTDKITIIGDFAAHTAETGYVQRGLQTKIIPRFLMKNIQWLNTNDPPKKLITEIDRFDPDFIGGYVGMLGHLALLKEEGYGKQIQPRCIISTGAVLDETLKKFISTTFNSPVFEAYGATESGPIAYQCRHGTYHVMSDLVYLEVLKNNTQAVPNTPGQVVITKLYGSGTPFIRYTSINDIVSLRLQPCSCGLPGPMLERIYGRDDLSLVTPDNKLMLPASISEIFSKILYGLKTRIIKDVQIIQHTLTSLEINVVLDPSIPLEHLSIKDITSSIQQGFREKLGVTVDIQINIVAELEHAGPRIISKVDRKKREIQGYV